MTVSYDYVHYGMEINLWKAQLILDGIIAGETASISSTSVPDTLSAAKKLIQKKEEAGEGIQRRARWRGCQ